MMIRRVRTKKARTNRMETGTAVQRIDALGSVHSQTIGLQYLEMCAGHFTLHDMDSRGYGKLARHRHEQYSEAAAAAGDRIGVLEYLKQLIHIYIYIFKFYYANSIIYSTKQCL